MHPQAHDHARRRLFVYGTLRRGSGHPMSRALAHNARWLGPGAIRGRRFVLGPYPAVQADEGAGWIWGDVFETLAGGHFWQLLDRYEGCHDANPCYERQRVVVWLNAGGRGLRIDAWCYLIRPATTTECASGAAG